METMLTRLGDRGLIQPRPDALPANLRRYAQPTQRGNLTLASSAYACERSST
jgi:hypothetical protein